MLSGARGGVDAAGSAEDAALALAGCSSTPSLKSGVSICVEGSAGTKLCA